MPRNIVSIKTFAAIGLLALAGAAASPYAWAKGAGMAAIDTDNDGSVSMDEAHAAAEKKFDKLDSKHAGKLTAKQVSPISKAMTEMARHDKDHTIDKTEYMSGVDAAFKEADPKGMGKLDSAALKTPAGKRFMALVE